MVPIAHAPQIQEEVPAQYAVLVKGSSSEFAERGLLIASYIQDVREQSLPGIGLSTVVIL